MQALLRLPHAAVEGTEPVVLPNFLSEGEIETVFEAATVRAWA